MTERVYHRRISGGVGMDLGGTDGRPVDLCNLFRDYSVPGDPAWRTVPGFRLHSTFSGKINGIYEWGTGILYENETETRLFLVHAGTKAYLVRGDDGESRAFTGVTLANAESRGCRFDDWYYLLDGTGFFRFRVYPGGEDDPILWGETVGGYLPTCILNGEAYEPANLLSDSYRIAVDVCDPTALPANDEGFLYGLGDAEGEATLLSASSASGDVILPETVRVGDRSLKLTAIGKQAFAGNLTVTSVVLSDGIKKIGSSAFRGCTALTAFSGGESLTVIGLNAFQNCTALTDVTFPGTLTLIRSFAFSGCSALAHLYYGGEDFSDEVGVSILGNSSLTSLTPTNGSDGSGAVAGSKTVTFDAPADSVVGVSLGSSVLSSSSGDPTYSVTLSGTKAVSVTVTTTDRRKLWGKRLTVTLSAASRRPGNAGIREDLSGYTGGISDMIRHCTLIAVFDGRLFLSGNPDLPDTVFYSCRTAAGTMNGGYYGVYQYVRDGAGNEKVTALVPSPDALLVFTSGAGKGGVYRHTAANAVSDQLPRIYPRESGIIPLGEVGCGILYRDAPVYVTGAGIESILASGLRYERTAVCRSEGIASRLPADPSDVRLTVWDGYLVVLLPGGEVFLGDGRRMQGQTSGGAGFEWWRLSGIGGHSEDTTVYRYSSVLPSGAAALGITLAPEHLADRVADGTVTEESGILSVGEGAERYAVYGGHEKTGGTLLPPTAIVGVGSDLLFGTADGKIYRFNTDKRGLPPSRELSGMTGPEIARYRAAHPGEIAPEWYDFDGHPIRVSLETGYDDGGLPSCRKNTVSGSAFLDLDLLPRSSFTLTVYPDGRTGEETFSVNASGLDFSSVDFSAFSFEPIRRSAALFRERCRGWHRKRYLIRADAFRTPVSLSGILYRETDAGKVRRP